MTGWLGINTGGAWRGQYSSGPRGLFCAVTAMRRGFAQGTVTEARITEDVSCRAGTAADSTQSGRNRLITVLPDTGVI